MAHPKVRTDERKAFKVLLALTVGVTASLVLPNLRGDPPRGGGQKPEQKEAKVQIRFPGKTVSDKDSGKPSSEANTASDIAKQNKAVDAPVQGAKPPITVATSEEKNQKIAEDWKDPLFVIFVTGSQTGYIEPCGCTGLENQKGGLSRRDTFLTSIRDRGWEVVPIDGGGQVFQVGSPDPRRGYQADIKFKWTTNAFNMLGYQAVGFGEDDLLLNTGDLMYAMIDKPGLFVSANVSIAKEFDLAFKTLTVKGKKIGITTVLGDENAKKASENKEVTIAKAIPALKEVAGKLRAEKCDYMVLVSHASLEESRAIAKAVPGFSLIITSGGFGEPTFQPEQIPGTNSQMVQVGTKGMYTGLFGVFNDPKQPFPLSARCA